MWSNERNRSNSIYFQRPNENIKNVINFIPFAFKHNLYANNLQGKII